MGKKKKIAEKVRLFYRGPLREPTKIADESELQIIADAIKSSLIENSVFKTVWNGQELTLKLQFGLRSALRSLKRKQTLGLIYDDTASIHLTKFLNEFAFKQSIPIIQAHNLSGLVDSSKIQSILVVSIVNTPEGISNQIRPEPKLFQLLQKLCPDTTKLFKLPIVDRVKC